MAISRWWEQYCFLPWPDSLAFFLRGLVTGGDSDQNRMIRRSGRRSYFYQPLKLGDIILTLWIIRTKMNTSIEEIRPGVKV